MITSAKYYADLTDKRNLSITILQNDKILSVPLDPDNTEYIEIMRLVDAGELTIEPADE